MNKLFVIGAIILTIFSTDYLFGSKSSGPEIKILVNQAGYDVEGPKQLWLQTDFPPRQIKTFQILHESNAVYQGYWGPIMKIEPWQQWYRTGDFSCFSQSGKYKVRIEWKGKYVESPPFWVDFHRITRLTAPLAAQFFFIQRCGTEVPGWHGPCHLDDAVGPDGRHLDLKGGWHDDGSYYKQNGYAPLAVYSLAKLAKSRAARLIRWKTELPRPLEEALWGADWLRKCQDPVTKKLIAGVRSNYWYWIAPEAETDDIPGTADDRPVIPDGWNENEMAVAAYAVLYQRSQDPQWQQAALELWNVIEQHNPGQSIPQRSKRLLAAVELYRAVKDIRFQRKAESEAAFLIQKLNKNGSWPLWPLAVVDYGLPAASLAEFALEFPGSDLNPYVLKALQKFMDFWNRRRALPFDIPKWSEKEYFAPYFPDKWYVGQNSMYLSLAWAGFLMAKVLPVDWKKAWRLAYGCLDWVLGANPFGVCMMYKAGTIHLKHYHHRYDCIPNGKDGLVPGAICNGLIRQRFDLDKPYLDLKTKNWHTNEPWLPHDAYYLLALTALENEPWEMSEAKDNRKNKVKY